MYLYATRGFNIVQQNKQAKQRSPGFQFIDFTSRHYLLFNISDLSPAIPFVASYAIITVSSPKLFIAVAVGRKK